MLHCAKILFFNKNLSRYVFFSQQNKSRKLASYFFYIFFYATYTEWTKNWFYSSILCAFGFLFRETLTLKKLNLYWTCYFSLFGLYLLAAMFCGCSMLVEGVAQCFAEAIRCNRVWVMMLRRSHWEDRRRKKNCARKKEKWICW